MNWTCRDCKETIVGYKPEHCPECHGTFGGTRAGGLRRVGATDPVLVRVEGPQSEDTPIDWEFGEVLVLPETAEVIEDSPVWALISYLIDLVDEDYTLTHDQLVDKAEEWLENNR